VAGLAKQTVVLSVARFANYGLMFISPIILVRLLSVEQFGEYRQFVLYASYLQLMAAFSFADSLLYFIPAHERSVWRVVWQTNVLVLCSSGALVGVVALLDLLTRGALVGAQMLPLAAYVLLFTNLDFWEYYFLATRRPGSVFAYTAGRLAARMGLVVAVAYLSADVAAIIWSLVALEAARFAVAAVAWLRIDGRANEPALQGVWGEQLRYCIPTGVGMILFMTNRNLGALAVTKVLGPVALAHYTIGTYADYVYLALGNSIAAVVLPEMVRRHARSKEEGLRLWQKSTVVNTLLLLPAAVLLARFARPIIVTVFGNRYLAAVPVLQIHMLFLVRACIDFSPALRAIRQTKPLVYSNSAALATNAVLLWWLLGRAGIRGAVTALVISSFVELAVLAVWTSRGYRLPLRKLVPLGGMSKVAMATAAGAVVLASPLWDRQQGLWGASLGAVVFYGVLIGAIHLLRLEEARELWRRALGFRMAVGSSPP
jgi:O-antigen/teichoic acid export membrane protein